MTGALLPLTLAPVTLIRGTCLVGFPGLMRDLGADPEPVLRASGIPLDAVGDIDSFVGYSRVMAVLESAARVTDAPDFGLQLAQRQDIDILGPVSAAALSAPTVGEGIEAIGRYLAFYSRGLRVSLTATDHPGRVRLGLAFVVENPPAHRQTTELTLGLTLKILRLLSGSRPLCVHVPHDPVSAPDSYERHYGAHVRFAEPSMGFTLRARDLDGPLGQGGELHRCVTHYLDRALADEHPPGGESDLVASVTTLVRHLLPTRRLTIGVVAAHLALHPKTLQRQLTAQGHTFDQLVDSVRRDVAGKLLRDTDMPLGQISGLLGYSEQSTFSRRCRHWFAASPRAARLALRVSAEVN